MTLCLEQNTQFLIGGHFAFYWYPIKNNNSKKQQQQQQQQQQIGAVDTACFPWSETTKIPQMAKINLHKNSAMAMMCNFH